MSFRCPESSVIIVRWISAADGSDREIDSSPVLGLMIKCGRVSMGDGCMVSLTIAYVREPLSLVSLSWATKRIITVPIVTFSGMRRIGEVGLSLELENVSFDTTIPWSGDTIICVNDGALSFISVIRRMSGAEDFGFTGDEK